MGLGKSLRCNCDCWANGGGEQRSALSISCCFCFVESLQKTSTWRKKIHKKKRRSTNYGTNRKQIHKSQQKTRVATRHCCSLRRLHTAATPWGDRHGSRGSRSMCRAESRTIDWDVATRQSPCHEVKREKHRKNRKKSWRSFSFLFVGSLEAKQNKIWQLNINWMYIMYIRSTFPKCSSVINALELGRWSWWDLSTWLALMATCDGFVFKQRRLPEFGDSLQAAGHESHDFRHQRLCIRIDLLQVEVRMPPLEIPAAVALNFVSPNSIVVLVVIVMTCSFQGINALWEVAALSPGASFFGPQTWNIVVGCLCRQAVAPVGEFLPTAPSLVPVLQSPCDCSEAYSCWPKKS